MSYEVGRLLVSGVSAGGISVTTVYIVLKLKRVLSKFSMSMSLVNLARLGDVSWSRACLQVSRPE